MNLSPENRLLLACSRVKIEKKAVSYIQQLAEEGIDWDLFIQICIRQKVLPLVFQNLVLHCSDSFPQDLRHQLEETYILENSLNNLELVEQLFFILDLFKNKEIVAVPFKGPLLAEQYFGDISMRRYLDLDILISQSDAEKAVDLLLANGFEAEDTTFPQGKARSRYLKKVVHLHLIQSKNRIPIDLQWDISNRFSHIPVTIEGMKNRLELVNWNNSSVYSLPGEELLCYLCIHGARHRWLYLDFVCCVSELLRVRKDLDWQYVQKYSEKIHCVTVLLVGLSLARELMGSEIPSSIMQRFDNNTKINTLTETLIEDLFSNYMDTMVVPDTFDPYLLQMRDIWIDKLVYVSKVVFIPTKVDLRMFRVPELFSFLRYFLRPMRLGGTYLKRRVLAPYRKRR